MTLRRNGHDQRAVRVAHMSGQGIEADASAFDSYVGWYQLSPGSVLTIRREGDRITLQATDSRNSRSRRRGRMPLRAAMTISSFPARRPGQGEQGPVSGSGVRRARVAPRVTAAKASSSRTNSRGASPKCRIGFETRCRPQAAGKPCCAGSRTCSAAPRTMTA